MQIGGQVGCKRLVKSGAIPHLIRLARTGHWNNWQIRQIAPFLWGTPEQPLLTLRVTASGHRMYLWTGDHVEGRDLLGFPRRCGR